MPWCNRSASRNLHCFIPAVGAAADGREGAQPPGFVFADMPRGEAATFVPRKPITSMRAGLIAITPRACQRMAGW